MQNVKLRPTDVPKWFWYSLVSIVVVLVVIPFNLLKKLIARSTVKRDFEAEEVVSNQTPLKRFVFQQWTGDTTAAQEHRIFVYFLMPALGGFALMVILPFFMGVYYSFTNWSGLNSGRQVFIGLENYIRLINDYRFFYSFVRTAIYSVLNIISINAVAFALALVVTQKLKLKNVYRAGFFMPNLIGGLVLGYIWQFIFNRALIRFGGVFATSLLIDGNTAMFGLIAVVTWQYAGYIMMIYIAALQNVPVDLIEASKIEGANAFQRLRHILLPLVAQAFTISLFLTLVTSFKQFDTVQSLTQGFPSMLLPEWIMNLYGVSVTQTVFSLDFIASDIYKEAFTRYNMGFGQAKAILFFVILAMISLIQVYFNKRREVEL
jgi:raffinose/stachyose/melibiose transport system permease protein